MTKEFAMRDLNKKLYGRKQKKEETKSVKEIPHQNAPEDAGETKISFIGKLLNVFKKN